MTRRVPEAAIVVGVLFATTWLVFPVLVGEVDLVADPASFLGYVGVAAALFYPFAAYTVTRAADPDDTIPPRPVLAVAAAVGLLCVTLGLAGGEPLLGLLVGLGVAVPAAVYAVVFGAVSPPPVPTLVAGTALGIASLAGGLVLGQPWLGGLAALFAFLPALGMYDHLTNDRLPTRWVLGATVLATLAVVGFGLGVAASPTATLAAVLTVAFGGIVAARVAGVPPREAF
ncbi:hypothetical protein [Haloarchaeobius sp. HME9146]|uniref:hypothetical protein n=1 Tax=Haloarchaeobius sp. HME9146 TaxID=2978732 RepID=UPI0021BFC269|nr:hypothetical protein [Haloarchaeobius sp. HME9146]MCT9094636.1 hypothetical protein [Haloarchaeobius sp. HME9146]